MYWYQSTPWHNGLQSALLAALVDSYSDVGMSISVTPLVYAYVQIKLHVFNFSPFQIFN